MSKLSIFRRFTSKRCGAQFLSDNTINIRAYSSSSSSLYSWRSTEGALSAGASIISWRGGDSIIKSASGV